MDMTNNRMKNPLILVLIALVLIIQGCASLSGNKDGELSWKKKLKIANKLYAQGVYYDAADFYQQVHDEVPENTEVTYKLAEAYNLSRDYKKAETYYKEVYDKNKTQFPLAQYKYAVALHMNGKYTAAKNEYKTFSKKYRGDQSRELKKACKAAMAGCDYSLEAKKKPIKVTIKHLGTTVNAPYTEGSPMPMGDTALLYTSLRSDTVIIAKDAVSEGYLFRFYKSIKNGNNFSQGVPMPDIVNPKDGHVGNGTFSPDGKYFYFTKCIENDKGKVLCSIYRSRIKKGVWKDPEPLNDLINLEGYSNTHPTIGPYKKEGMSILYFTSDRPEGQGGMDIWYSVIGRKGEFKTPKNLGRKVNTVNDDLTPFYDNETKQFYFSSNGHPGFGGYDVFKTEGMMKKWAKPENVGYPLNSSVDDIYYVTDKKGGYLVSNRPGVIALKNETCCDDIFRFDWTSVIYLAVDGFVYDKDDSTQTWIPDAKVKLFSIEKESGEEVFIEEAMTKKDSLYFFKLNKEKDYVLTALKDGYFAESAKVNTKGFTKSDTLHTKIPIWKLKMNESFVIKDIYYDFDKATLRPESKKSLDSLKQILQKNPEIIVELSSHTDSKGNDIYNQKLSQKRAESVVKYLIEQKIPANRLKAKGYGESKPIVSNTNPDGTDNPENRQLNRRTEITVVGKLDVKKLDFDEDFDE